MSSRTVHTIFATLLAAVPLACAAADAPTTPPADTPQGAVATVNGEPITDQQLAEAVGGRVVTLEQQIYQARIEGIREIAFQRLIEAAAKAAGVTPEVYYASQVTDKVEAPAEQMIESVLQQYRDRLPPDDAQARVQVDAFLRQQQARRLDAGLRERVLSGAKLVMLIDPPRFDSAPAVFNPGQGPTDAPVTLVEFSDFQCPFCQRVQPTVTAVMERYPGKVRHVFRQLPLDMHDQARLAAEASLCAADQGKFWQLHDWMFANQRAISEETLTQQATALELDAALFEQCLASDAHVANIEVDMAEAARLGINGTPGFLINGRLISGAQPLETFVQTIDDELQRLGVATQEPAPEAPAS